MGYISVQYNNNNSKSKVTKRTHFYRKQKPLSRLLTIGSKNKNFYLLIV